MSRVNADSERVFARSVVLIMRLRGGSAAQAAVRWVSVVSGFFARSSLTSERMRTSVIGFLVPPAGVSSRVADLALVADAIGTVGRVYRSESCRPGWDTATQA